MSQLSYFPNQETYQRALASLKDYGEIQLDFFNALTEQQKTFLTTWWQRKTEHASTITTVKDLPQWAETVQKATNEEIEALQQHAKATFDVFSTTGRAVSAWYEKQRASTPTVSPASVSPARAAPSTSKAA